MVAVFEDGYHLGLFSASSNIFLTMLPVGVLTRPEELLQKVSRFHKILDFLVDKRARPTPYLID